MKNPFLKALSLLCLPLACFIMWGNAPVKNENVHSYTPPLVNTSDDFFNCIFNDAFIPGWNEPMWITKHLDKYKDSLHFNAIQHYQYSTDYYGIYGALLTGPQKTHVEGLMDSVYNKGLRCLYGRPNIEVLCYGQRLIFEAEGGNNGFSYTYRHPQGSVITDGSRSVVKIEKSTSSSANWLCSNIYENLQFSDLIDFNQADQGSWFLKPVLKIKQSDFDDPAKQNMEVIKIFAVNYEGDTIIKIPIKVRNFGDISNPYNGSYTSNYFFTQGDITPEVSGSRSNGLGEGMSDGNFYDWDDDCKIDLKIWWPNNVDVWFDKMIADDERADPLFSGTRDTLIRQETALFNNYNASNYAFFADEVLYSNIPCIHYVDSIMGAGSRLHVALSNYHNVRSMKNDDAGYSLFMQANELNSFNCDAHEIGECLLPPAFNTSAGIPNKWKSSSGADYTNSIQNSAFGDKTSITAEGPFPGVYSPPWRGSLIYQTELARAQRDTYAPNMKFIMQPQIHGWVTYNPTTGLYNGPLREPTNEEISAQAMISIAHGAEGLCWFWYTTQTGDVTDIAAHNPVHPMWENVKADVSSGDQYFYYGLVNTNASPRHLNMYGQDKFKAVKNMNVTIEKWKPVLDNIRWTSGWSVHSEGAGHEYISNIKSIYRDIASPFDYSPSNEDAVKYWEMAFFDKGSAFGANDKSKFFMMVNRRCIPDQNNDGDLRRLKIQFDAADLAEFKNWKLINVIDSSVIRIFDKDSSLYIDCGEFQPGEGKLFKLAPVMQEGGTLVCDEETNADFDCKGEVLNNGFDVYLKQGCDVSFYPAGKITMTGGVFKTGNIFTDNPSNPGTTLKNKGESKWDGITLNACDEVDMFRTTMEGISQPGIFAFSPNYCVTAFNCASFSVNGCEFNSEGNTGAITASYAYEDRPPAMEIAVQNSTFDPVGAGNTGPIVNFSATGDVQVPVMIMNNTFNSTASNSVGTGIFLNNIVGGAIKDNTMNEFATGIIMTASSMDLYHNYIIASSSLSGATGVSIASGTMLNMSDAAYYFLGGFNKISGLGTGNVNILSDNSTFDIDEGYNTFDIKGSPSTEYHFYGTIAGGPEDVQIPGLHNCFNQGGEDGESYRYELYWDGTLYPFEFSLDPFGCVTHYEPDSYVVVDLGKAGIDTIFFSNVEPPLGRLDPPYSPLTGGKPRGSEEGGSTAGVTTASPQELYNSICLETRKRNYSTVCEKSAEFLDSYADSLQALDVIAKYYLASQSLDSNGSRMSSLKTLFETLILNHGNNTSLVDKCFYYVQKCKAALGDYQSAMDGFAQIISQNPGTYEALVASWDYAAVSLMGNGGNGGGMRQLQITNYELRVEESGVSNDVILSEAKDPLVGKENAGLYELDELDKLYELYDPRDKYNEKEFTKEDRKTIRTNVVKTYKDKRAKQEEEIKQLEVKAQNGDETAIKQLEVKKVLKEEIRTYRPNTMQEHIQKMNASIQKVFGKTTSGSKTKDTQLPAKFDLSQNYPNPFNPATKINYELPKDAKVKLIVYDILGREVARLVNNEFRSAGRYIVEFNGSSLSSGVYFYRIETDTPEKFVMVKKMVLVK